MASPYVTDGLAAIATIANTAAGTQANTDAITRLTAQLASDEASESDVKTLVDALIKQLAVAPTPTTPALPVIASISPATGPIAGGTIVTLTGTGFTGATAVNFGTTAGTDLSVAGDTTLTVTSPPLPAGQVDITVVTPAGTSVIGAADQFTFA